MFFTKAMKGNVTAFTKNENIETNNVRDKHPFTIFSFIPSLIAIISIFGLSIPWELKELELE